jgi:inhibitor of cysteine peptidase
MKLNRLTAIGAVFAALGLSACVERAETPPAPASDTASRAQSVTEPAPTLDPFDSAAILACGASGEVRLLMEGDPPTARVKMPDGTEHALPMLADSDPPTFTNGKLTLFMRGGDFGLAVGRAAEQQCEGVSRPLEAPTPPGVVRTVTEEDAGARIELKPGESFAVALVGVPTAGYLWDASKLPPFLAKTGETGGPTSTAQLLPGFAGGSHWEVLVFTANAAGEGDLVLAQRRPWEDQAEPDAKTFSVTVTAR